MLRPQVLLFFIFVSISLASGQLNKLDTIAAQVGKFNDSSQYEKTLILLNDFISSKQTTPYEKSWAHIFKSYTFKRLFNYPKALQFLDTALSQELSGSHLEEITQVVKAEKALIYFDLQEFEIADSLIKELALDNYKYLDEYTKVWIFLQEGYSLTKQKKYTLAENRINDAMDISIKSFPDQLLFIYGKKIDLYNEMGEYDKRDSTFAIALKNATESKLIKNQMNLYQVMYNIYKNNNDYKNAFIVQSKFDSLEALYNPYIRSAKLDILEQQLAEKNRENLVQHDRQLQLIQFLLIGFLSLLSYFLFRLFKSYKREHQLIEKQNKLISSEIDVLTKKLEETKNTSLDCSKYPLTERQLEIIALIRAGKTNREIAGELFISENTVKYHLKAIYEILNVSHRSQIK